jgi:hypothetical protein
MPDENPLPRELNSWEAAQQHLSVKFPWLQAALDKKVDSEIKNSCIDVLTKASDTANRPGVPTPTYDPFQVESLLAEVSESLDRCLALRKEVYDYETIATQFALDYKLFEDQTTNLESLENTGQTKLQRDAEAQGQTNANAIFGRDPGTLPTGFAAMAKGAAESASIAAKWETDKQRHVDGKWRGLKIHWNILLDRHSSDGCALNFGQRKERSLEILINEFRSTYGKALAAEVGLQRIFAIKYPTSVAAIDSLDELVRWARWIIDQLYRYKQDESTFELVVPLVRQFTPDAEGLIKHDDYMKKMNIVPPPKHARFDVDISKAIPPYMNHLRLKGVGLSFAWNEVDDNDSDLSPENSSRYK